MVDKTRRGTRININSDKTKPRLFLFDRLCSPGLATDRAIRVHRAPLGPSEMGTLIFAKGQTKAKFRLQDQWQDSEKEPTPTSFMADVPRRRERSTTYLAENKARHRVFDLGSDKKEMLFEHGLWGSVKTNRKTRIAGTRSVDRPHEHQIPHPSRRHGSCGCRRSEVW